MVAGAVVGGGEDLRFVTGGALPFHQLDQPGRNDVALGAGKRGHQVQDAHGLEDKAFS